MVESHGEANPLDRISFLVGEWRGSGVFRFLTSKRPEVRYQIRYMCKESPDRNELLIVEFDDDPEKEEMFHASQGFLYVEPKTNQLRLKRTTLMESAKQGLVHEENWEVSNDLKEIKIDTLEKDRRSGYGRTVMIRRVGDSRLTKEGRVVEGREQYEYKETLTRRRASSARR